MKAYSLNSGSSRQSETSIPRFSVRQLNTLLEEILRSAFPRFQLQGEVSNLSRPKSGHIYFSLKGEGDQISAVFFRAKQSASRDLSDGAEVCVTGRLGVYGPRGTYQVIVEDVDPVGQGDIKKRLKVLRDKLDKEGLFDLANKKEIPFMPRRLGVVTSSTGAAVRDIIEVCKRRFPGVDILLYPTRVQGEEAATEIAGATLRASFEKKCDLLIVGRGGGSEEDLWPFNEEVVVRAVASCEIPVISAVGHETDFVLTDLAADRRALTPSEAAEMAYPEKKALESDLSKMSSRLRRAIEMVLQRSRRESQEIKNHYFFKHPERYVQVWGQKLDDLNQQLHQQIKSTRDKVSKEKLLEWKKRMVYTVLLSTQSARQEMNSMARDLKKTMLRKLSQPREELESLPISLKQGVLRVILNKRETLKNYQERLHTSSPLALSKRGYHLLQDQKGKLVTEKTELNLGQEIKIRQPNRSIVARVEKVIVL